MSRFQDVHSERLFYAGWRGMSLKIQKFTTTALFDLFHLCLYLGQV